MLLKLVRLSALLITPNIIAGQNVVSVNPYQGGGAKAAQGVSLDTPVSISGRNISLRDALVSVSSQVGSKAVFSDEVRGSKKTVTLSLAAVPARRVFDEILKGTGIVYKLYPSGEIAFAGTAAAAGRLENGVVAGRVTDAKTGRGISGATVSVGGDARGVTTDENGSYQIRSVAAGTHIVLVRLVGYAKQTHSVTVGEGATVTVDFKLEPSASVLDQVVVTGTIVATELKAVPSAITVITAKQLEERGITRIDQLFRGDIPGLFALNRGSNLELDDVTMFSRGATALSSSSAGTLFNTNPIKTYLDGVELADAKYLSQLDPASIERIEILTGPQASTIYGSNAINGVMQIFTKRGTGSWPQLTMNIVGGGVENSFKEGFAPNYTADARISGVEGRWSYNGGVAADYVGSWSPGKNTVRYTGSGGGRADTRKLTADVTLRYGLTKNRRNGAPGQTRTNWSETGLAQSRGNDGISALVLSTLNGQTFGATLGYTPVTWWSHEVSLGSDANVTQRLVPGRGFLSLSDTLNGSIAQTNNARVSQRYTTTLRVPMAAIAQMTWTFGADHWRIRSSSFSGNSVTGSLSSPVVTRDKPSKNTGGFVQGQLSVRDAIFLTYGLRAEWNPNYGDDAQPNIAPRYGISYSNELGLLTMKLRGSYGRATRPPAQTRKSSVMRTSEPDYGNYLSQIESPDLGPEYQQGGEGGLELYLGNRASLIVTRYNQTVDALIGEVSPIDSVRSLIPNPSFSNSPLDAQMYGYRYQLQYLNIGSIRNQGWELQGSVNTGPFTTRATYSWTKSRVIGITPKYRSLVSGSAFQVGRAFDYVPEHTWATTVTYAHAATNVALTLNGNGQMYTGRNELFYLMGGGSPAWRLTNYQLRMALPSGYRSGGPGYAMAHVNAAHRFSSAIDATLQVQNLTNSYKNEVDAQYAVVGRQTKVGVRIRVK